VSEALATKPRGWTLVGRNPDLDVEARALHTREVLLAVLRRGLPSLVEATLVPTVLFLAVMTVIGAGAAMLAVLVWAFGAIGRRLVLRRRMPALLILSTVGLTVRTLIGLASGSAFAYFVQPVAATVALAAVFAGSVLIGRPVIARLAHDFVALDPEVASRPAVVSLFAGLTMLWAGVHLLNAATTFGLLVTLPVPMFVALKTIPSATISGLAVVITVVCALRTARHEQLVFQRA
jgi:hypothetical protein